MYVYVCMYMLMMACILEEKFHRANISLDIWSLFALFDVFFFSDFLSISQTHLYVCTLYMSA